MSLFDDIESLEQRLQKELTKAGRYGSIDKFEQAYRQAILEALGDFSNETLSTAGAGEIVKRALRESADFIDIGLQQDIEKSLNKIIGDTLDFYSTQGIVLPDLPEAVVRTEAAQVLEETFRTNMAGMRDELLDETVATMRDHFARGEINRESMADAIREAADAPMHHARTNARQVVSSWNRIGRDQVRREAGLKHGFYYGSPRVNSRTFCLRCIGQTFSIEQINLMDNGQGLPVIHYCGGWNCIHSWMWVEPEWDDDLEQTLYTGSVQSETDAGLELAIPAAD